MESNGISEQKIITGDSGYILQDVPHLTDYIPDLPVCFFFFSSIDWLIILLKARNDKKNKLNLFGWVVQTYSNPLQDNPAYSVVK